MRPPPIGISCKGFTLKVNSVVEPVIKTDDVN
jgi:hypothetical protein